MKNYKIFGAKLKAFSSTKGQPDISSFLDAVNIDKQQVYLAEQVHGDVVAEINDHMILIEDPRYPGVKMIKGVDALITNKPGLALITRTADCVPVMIFDPKNKVIANVHAGWKGTAKKIVAKTIKILKDKYGTAASDCLFAIGPSAGKCCYEVGEQVHKGIGEEFIENKAGKKYADLWSANIAQILSAGGKRENIETSGICTICNNDYFSYRREGKDTGRIFNMISILVDGR
ncbi:MAG: peptidoglycan editing factor PgeF [bacterium]